MSLTNEQKDKILKDLYYSKGGFMGMNRLWDLVKDEGIQDRYVRDWVSKQEVYQLHKIPRNFDPKTRIVAGKANELWFADLIDMQTRTNYNNGYSWILTIIDVFSKFAYAFPLKTKSDVDVLQALKELKTFPKKLKTDNGNEFTTSRIKDWAKEHNVILLQGRPHTPTDQAVIERFNGTLKQRLNKYMTANSSNKWIDALQPIISSYNSQKSRVIGTTPENALTLPPKKVERETHDYKYDVGDTVRTKLTLKGFEKGLTIRWTKETFKITKRYKRLGINFYSVNGKSFRESEIQKVDGVEGIKETVKQPVSQRIRKELKEIAVEPKQRSERPKQLPLRMRLGLK